ncbi:hypothetical protein [Thiorhodovibrio frisius]|uniref:VWA domain-containing protein n=1 Tax=Thiorhodovibrio frisius TaxID=631362 RepID=H8Z4T6_9GAMM|nr:hypothetical protein [Thiorhodovibrio frisius]EIC20343.1 hypothetical protein Thi970DRAFT_03970 [Thiorhodovibrio frisius]WPL21081.1 hypothetical protein Thiofri_01189 [Thiorhodovibrio frisius]
MPGRGRHRAADLLPAWQQAWPAALAAWSRFTRLPEPRFLLDEAAEQAEGLSGSFAMIRLNDHAVLVSLRQVAELGLERFAREVLAHEVGHHVLAPADLADNGRLLARLRAALPGLQEHAAFVGNLCTDLLINDRLARSAELDLAGLYQALKPKDKPGKLWSLYMRIYEQLWSLPSGTLTQGRLDPALRADAALGARLVRVYARDWLNGAGRFASLLYPYLATEQAEMQNGFGNLLDATDAGSGEVVPDGLAEIDEAEVTGSLDPRNDPELSGVDQPGDAAEPGASSGRETVGGRKQRYRGPLDYTELMEAAGVKVPRKELIMRYYRELARRHLIPFPSRRVEQASDPLPEGLDPWDPGEPLAAVDWLESMIRSPQVLPGLTTLQRSYGSSPGAEPEPVPLDLYLGIDCSGSMANPERQLSYPVLAGAVVALSALRAGARVMACLSGEPGKFDQTDGFVRSEAEVLKLLTGYLGTGYAFGIGRLQASILDQPPPKRPVHLLVISDADLFRMLDGHPNGWQVAEQAALKAGGGATAVLNLPYQYNREENSAMVRLEGIGWQVHQVSSQEQLVSFARTFARATYHRKGRP